MRTAFNYSDFLNLLPAIELTTEQMNDLYMCIAPENFRFSGFDEGGEPYLTVTVPIKVSVKK